MNVLARDLARYLTLAAVLGALAMGCGGMEGDESEWLEGDDLAVSEDALVGSSTAIVAAPVLDVPASVTVFPQSLADAVAARLILQNLAPTSDLLVAGDSSPDPIPARGTDESASTTTDSERTRHGRKHGQ